MKVIKAMVKKMTSPSILGNYASLMSGVSDSFRTSLSDDEISSLVKAQLKNGGDWNVVSYSAVGTTGSEYTYSYAGKPLSIVNLNQTSVENGKKLIKKVMDGETLTQDECDSLIVNDK